MKKFRRFFAVFVCVAILLGSTPLGGFVGLDLPSLFDFKAEAASSGTCGEKLTWTLYESGLLEISGTGDMEIYSYSSFPWYSYRSSITAVNITSGVTSIGDYAFCYCERITTVTIPDSVKTIGEYVFVDCYDLASITIPVSVESIGQYAFGWYAIPYYSGTLEQWEAVETSSSDTSIDSRVIICGGTDRPYYIPGTCSTNVNWILYADGELVISGTGAMTNWSSASDAPWYSMSEKIKSITVENGVRSIGKYAFYNCNQVSKVTIADTVLIIEYYGFYGCSAKELTMPATVGIAGSTVFDNCMQIEKITLTKGSGVMHDYTTNTDSSYCYRYTPWYESRPKEIVIEDGVTNIGNYTFNSVNYLESIRIPASVTTIGVGAFGNCTDLTDVYYASTMEDWNKITTGSENEPLDTATIHTVTYSGTCGDNLTWVLYDTGRLEINGTGAMTSWTAANQTPWFNYSTGINEIIIGNGVTSIGKYAFFSCTVQKSVTISNSVTSIEASAFGNSQSITEIHYASDKSDWDKITVGGTNNALTQAQFDYGVKRLIAYGHVGELVEWELYTDGELSVIGEGGMSNYTSAEYYPWHKYRDIITSFTLDTYPGEYYPEMTNIGSHALEGCINLETVRIYSVLRTIGDYAFAGCTSLKSIVIPDTVTNIGDGAFYGCSGLNELTMPVSAKIYNSPDVFYGCTGIGKITLTKGNGTMVTYGTDTSPTASSVYYQYTPWYISVTQIDLTIEEGITAIPSYTFYGSKSIQNVTIPEGVTSIGVYAFYGCSALEKTYYGGDITGWCKIDFKDAYSTPMCFADNLYFVGELVTEVYISSTVTSIRNYTFYGCSGIKNVYYGSTEEDWNKISIGSYNEPLTSATIHFNTTQCKHSTDDLIWHTVVEPTCASGKENAVCSVCGYNGYYEVLCDSETYPNCVGKNQEFVDKTYSFTYPGAEKLILKFSEKTNIYEYLYIYNAKGDMIDCYTTDSQLAGKTVEVDGDSVDLRIVAETLYYWNGFSLDSIIAVMYVDGWMREKNALEDYPHDWSYEDGICTECGYQCPHKNVSNGVCTECSFCKHDDTDGDEVCDDCGGLIGAKILTVDSNGMIYADGDICYSRVNNTAYLESGKYKLIGNIIEAQDLSIPSYSEVKLDLNGYTWDLGNEVFGVEGVLSVYDSSAEKTGKITSSSTTTISLSYGGSGLPPTLNLFSGTVENTSSVDYSRAISFSTVGNVLLTANLYGGKIKSNYFDIYYPLKLNVLINIDGTILESGEGVAQLYTYLNSSDKARASVDVTDYTGDGLTVKTKINEKGRIKIFKGIKSAADSERYIIEMESSNGTYHKEKDEYDNATGEKYIHVVANAFTSQPTAENNYTADFNSSDATIQWYETEITELTDKNTTAFEYDGLLQATTSVGKWVVKGECVLFSYDVKAGCSLYVSSESYKINASVYVGDHTLSLNIGTQPEPITFDTDTTIYVRASADTMAVLGFTLVKNTLLEDETDEILHKPECGKSYFCRANVFPPNSEPLIFDSKTVTVSHNWNSGVCKICGNSCVESLNGTVIDTESNMIYGLTAGIDSLNDYITATDGLKWYYQPGQYGFGTGTVATLKDGTKTVAEYTVIIFGDIDGNGWYDANDAFLVHMIASGLVEKDRLGEAVWRAADCNHDGLVNELDFEILNNASVLLDSIDQSATQAELETNAIYIEYMSLIDQSAGVEIEQIPKESAPESNEPAEENYIAAVFAFLSDIISKILAFIISFIVV
ncbi:MAG: leucine-rich repeat protein [Clostridia bacterium]|nr:leucine-rich repeat protein [Clostridia bacterium]